ncbi:MAG TPA: ABC transporter permease [candidate division Zixibacteria bacterium]|nr:ABC transporter permease [candidate division Zixibacteria bacterium]
MREILRKTWAIAWKNLQVISKDRGELAILFLLPLLFASLLGLSSGGGSSDEDSTIQFDIYLVNEDQGLYGDMVISVLEEIAVLNIEELPSVEEADKLVGEGERLAAVIIPAGFSEMIDAYDRTALDVIVDPIQQVWANQVTGLVNYAVAPPTVYGEVQYAIRSLIDDSGLLEGADPAVRLAIEAQTIGAIMTQLQEMESDPLIVIDTPAGLAAESEESFNVFAIVIPGFTVMFAFFLIGTIAQAMHTEKDQGTFRRLLAAPLDRGAIVGGTMLAFMIIVFFQVVFLFGIAAVAFGMPIGNSIVGLLLVTLALSLAATSLGLLLASATKNGKQAGAFGLVLGFVLAGLGGALIQFRVYEAEGFLGFVGKLSPHAHAIEGYSRLMQDGLNAVDVVPQALILVGFSVVFFLAAMWLLKFE